MSDANKNAAPEVSSKKEPGIGWLGWTCFIGVILFVGWMFYVSSKRPLTDAELREEMKHPLDTDRTSDETSGKRPDPASRRINEDRSGQKNSRAMEMRFRAPSQPSPSAARPEPPSPTPVIIEPVITEPVRTAPTRPASTRPVPAGYSTENKRNYGKEP